MIDFHSHILPAMDDGSRNIEESLQMLRMLQEQGVERVIATPISMRMKTRRTYFCAAARTPGSIYGHTSRRDFLMCFWVLRSTTFRESAAQHRSGSYAYKIPVFFCWKCLSAAGPPAR